MIRVAFFGTPDFSAPALLALLASPLVEVRVVITQPDRPTGRGGAIQPPPIKRIALEHRIPVLQPETIRKDPGFLSAFGEFGPFDVGVVIAFGQILPVSVLDLPRAGSINIHASLLPRWRGAAPIHRAIMARDGETGVCLMRMEAGLDTGPVYSVTKTSIGNSDTTGDLHDRLATMGAELLIRDLPEIVNGSIVAIPQPEAGVTYAAKISTEDARLNWSGTSLELDAAVRAMSPFPGAWTLLDGKRFKILRASPVDVPYKPGEPADVVFVAPDRLEVACGAGALRLTEVQLEGKRRASIAEFLRGNPVREPLRFG